MATTVTTVINDVLKRVRDASAQLNATDAPPTTATGRAFVLTLINHCTIVVNLACRCLMGNSALYLSPGATVYDLTQSLAGSDYGGVITGCYVPSVSEIDGPVDYKALGRASRTWLVDTNAAVTSAPLSWSPIGNTLLALCPTFSGSGLIEVILRYMQAPPFIPSEPNNTIALPDYLAGYLARLVSLLSSLKCRQLTDFNTRFMSLVRDMGAMDAMSETGGKAD